LDHRTALGLTLGGIPAVLLAALLVKSLPLGVLRWVVVAVVVWTGISLLRAAFASRHSPKTAASALGQ
jgi:threonine/homoserine/homoserine lactone efflux protein